jgi:hypothetical protein
MIFANPVNHKSLKPLNYNFQPGSQAGIVGTGRLEEDQPVLVLPAVDQRCESRRFIGDPFGLAERIVKNVEMVFGDVATDKARLYGHGAYPCAARSGDAASINCSGWVLGTRAGIRAG